MTPQEQIEELKKAVNKLADLSVYLCEEVYDEPDGEKITDAVARFENGRDLVLRSIRFDSPQISEGEVTVSLTLEEARHCAAFSSPREAESFLGETQEVQVDRLARFFHSEFSSDRIAEWDDLEPLTQRIWNTEALRAYVFMLTGANPLDELETAGSDQPGRLEGVADAPSGPSRDIAPKKEDRS